MLADDKARVIGKVIGIGTDRLSVELSKDLVNFTLSGFDDIHYVAQLNSYVVIPYLNYYLVGEVVSVNEKDIVQYALNLKDQELMKAKSTKVIELALLGTIQFDKTRSLSFSFGVSVFPSLYSDVLYIKSRELDSIYNNAEVAVKIGVESQRLTHIPIGYSTIFKDYSVKIDIDKFYGAHSSVLGNTGSGKSCTISSMLQTLYRHENYSAVGSTFIVFDINGEYQQALGTFPNQSIHCKTAIVNSNNDFRLPHWYFTLEEWEILLNASEKAQRPILHNALGISGMLVGGDDAKINHIVASCIRTLFATSESPVSVGARVDALTRQYGRGDLEGSVLSNYRFSFKFGNFPDGYKKPFDDLIDEHIIEAFELPSYGNVPFEFSKIVEYIDLAILYEESHGNKQIRDYCSSMITRAKNVVHHPSFAFIGGDVQNPVEPEDFLGDILGIESADGGYCKKRQVYILDFNEAEDDAVRIASSVVSRMVLEFLKSADPRNRFPVNLIMEEAHRYISNSGANEFSARGSIYERIAKEGRKYGVFLLISSQRPSELSKTVLSQCSNFIVHRIQNPEDLSHIRQITPHISEVLLRRLPSVPQQHALVFGACVNVPSLVRVIDANPRPKSDDNRISENWFIPDGRVIELLFK